MRRIFSTVFGPHEPALTVGSFAISATRRPPTSAMPVTTPSAPRPSWSQLASSASSAKDSGSTSRATRSRTRDLALVGQPLAVLLRAAGQRALERLAEALAGPGASVPCGRQSSALRDPSGRASHPSNRRSPRPDLRPRWPAVTSLRRVGGGANRRSRYSSNMISPTDCVVSRPTKSSSSNGPIGWLAPPFIAASICSIEPNALLVGADRVEQVRDQQPVDDEARLVLRVHDRLLQRLAELEALLERPGARRRSTGPPRAAASPARG